MWEIAVVIAVVVFSITCGFLIRTLVTLNRAILPLQLKIEHLSDESQRILKTAEHHLTALDSTFNSISNLGDVCENKTESLKRNFTQRQSISSQDPPIGEEILNWALTSASLYQKFFKNRSK